MLAKLVPSFAPKASNNGVPSSDAMFASRFKFSTAMSISSSFLTNLTISSLSLFHLWKKFVRLFLELQKLQNLVQTCGSLHQELEILLLCLFSLSIFIHFLRSFEILLPPLLVSFTLVLLHHLVRFSLSDHRTFSVDLKLMFLAFKNFPFFCLHSHLVPTIFLVIFKKKRQKHKNTLALWCNLIVEKKTKQIFGKNNNTKTQEHIGCLVQS